MSEDISDQAWQWHCALQREDADWDGFTMWLEADPAHRTTYDAVALTDDMLDRQRDRLRLILPAEQEVEPPRAPRRWGRWTAGATAAAALALVLAIPLFQDDAADASDYRTSAGQTREIALADGSHIVLGPSSHLAISGERQDQMALEGGAWFDIRHDPRRQLIINAGGQTISDIGTRFDVLALDGHVRVAVAEGRVSVASDEDDTPVVIPAGRRIAINAAKHSARIEDVIVQDVGGWRAGRLMYDDVPLSLVAADISRYVGRKIVVAPDVAERRFSGVLAAGNGADLVQELGEVMGLETRTQGNTVRLSAGRR